MSYIKKLMQGKQNGITFIELLVAMLITSIIAGGIIVVITQLFSIPNDNSARLIAVMQVDNAIDAINRDAVQSQTISVNTTGDFLYMTWTYYGMTSANVVVYTINSSGTLMRSFDGGTATSVATNIAVTDLSYSNNVLTFTISSTVAGKIPATEARQVQILQRG
jgi:Tfp pilus assembly protein PilV